jgi:DNA-binding response OmpR family regulator
MLILDVTSFGTKGYQVCDSLRSQLPNIPTILLLEKGHATAGSTADAYMVPPFTTRKLLYRVKKVALQLRDRQIQAGPLALDPQTRLLYKDDEVTQLRPQEAALLVYFLRNPSRVLSRRELMQEVWDTDYVADTRTLSVHVRWLRLKIEEDPSHPQFLRTVRGVGYRFQIPRDPPEE